MAPTPPGPQASVCHPGASTGAFRSGRAPVMMERRPRHTFRRGCSNGPGCPPPTSPARPRRYRVQAHAGARPGIALQHEPQPRTAAASSQRRPVNAKTIATSPRPAVLLVLPDAGRPSCRVRCRMVAFSSGRSRSPIQALPRAGRIKAAPRAGASARPLPWEAWPALRPHASEDRRSARPLRHAGRARRPRLPRRTIVWLPTVPSGHSRCGGQARRVSSSLSLC